MSPKSAVWSEISMDVDMGRVTKVLKWRQLIEKIEADSYLSLSHTPYSLLVQSGAAWIVQWQKNLLRNRPRPYHREISDHRLRYKILTLKFAQLRKLSHH